VVRVIDYGTLRLDHQSEPIVVHLQHCTLLPAPVPEGWVNVYPDPNKHFNTHHVTRGSADSQAVPGRIGIWHLRSDRTAEYIETPQ
jgi:hypothetical protein